MALTYATAPRYALHRAQLDVGERWWDDISLEEQNSRVAHHLQRLWRIIDDAHRARMRVERAERQRRQREAA